MEVRSRAGADPPPTVYCVSNEIDRKVRIRAVDGSVLVLRPFEVRKDLTAEDVTRFALDRWTDTVLVAEQEPTEATHTGLVIIGGLAVWFSIAWGILPAFVGTPTWWDLGWAGLVGVFLVGGVIDLLRSWKSKTDAPLRATFLHWARTWGGQQLNLTLSLLVGIVLPAAAIFFAGDALSLIDRLRQHGVQNEHAVVLTLIGRLMQVSFVAIASLAPALLFFWFDREHLDTLRFRFVSQIMRFDPTVKTRQDVGAKYQNLMDEAYGPNIAGKILPGRRTPVLLATVVIALGWTFTLLHGDVRIISEGGITSLFEPRMSAVSFAFLGAYFYGINSVLRGYVSRDLRPKMYGSLTVRVLIVVVLAWVLELLWGGPTLYVLAFLTGIVPETALVLLKENLRNSLQKVGPLDDEPDPLTNLEGIDLYDRARLFDEGVTNIESLAHHDFVELMLQTRIPASRLVDWVDQAILYLHAGPPGRKADGQIRADTLTKLRTYGIRTATDLDDAFKGARERGALKPLLTILGPEQNGVPRLQVIKDTLDDEEWMVNLRNWRRRERVVPSPLGLSVADLR